MDIREIDDMISKNWIWKKDRKEENSDEDYVNAYNEYYNQNDENFLLDDNDNDDEYDSFNLEDLKEMFNNYSLLLYSLSPVFIVTGLTLYEKYQKMQLQL